MTHRLSRWGGLLLAVATSLQITAAPIVAATGPADCILPGDARCEAWTTSHDVTAYDVMTAATASPSGDSIFVTGIGVPSPHPSNDILTIAFDGEDGSVRWSATTPGLGGSRTTPTRSMSPPTARR